MGLARENIAEDKRKMAGRKYLIVAAAALTAILGCGVQAKAMPVTPLQSLASAHEGAATPAVETVGWHLGWGGWHHRHHWRRYGHYRHYGYYRHYRPWHYRSHWHHHRHWYGGGYRPAARVYRF
jgi:hypothetical protein